MMRFRGRKRIILRIIYLKSEEIGDENNNIFICYFWVFGIEKFLII